MLNWTLRLWHQWNSVLISISFWCDQETMFCSSETSKNSYQKKFNFTSFNWSRITFDRLNLLFQSIKWRSRINRVNPGLCDEFLQFFDRSNRNQESIESSENLKWICWIFQSIEKYLRWIEWTVFWYFTKC